jgi:Zn-dependent protease
MGWSLNLGAVAGTAIRIHFTFFLLLAWIGAMNWQRGGPGQAFWGVLFILILFLCVTLHEFGHILAARRYGIRTPEITLLPIGGVASLERMPEKPAQEIVVALAGPAVNVAIAALLMVLLGLMPDPGTMLRLEDAGEGASLLQRVLAANVILAVFNMIPAFPMDGGRVLRAVLALNMSYARATRIAARIGQGLALVLGFLGLFGNPLLVLVAVFIFFAAAGEAGYVEGRDLTRGYLARDAMITDFRALGPMSSIDDAADLLLRTTQREFPVVDGAGQIRGMIDRDAVIAALRDKGGQAPVIESMNREVATVPERATLETILPMLQAKGATLVAVVDPTARVQGYITQENVAELLMIRSSREARAQAAV